MTATTFEAWKKSDGASFAQSSDDQDALRAAYDYARSHPKAGYGDVENYWLGQIRANAEKSSKGGSSLFDEITHPYNKSIEDNLLPIQAAQQTTAGASGASGASGAPGPVTSTANPDAAAAVNSLKGTPFAGILQQALAAGAGGSVTLWDGLGVDKDAPVFGGVRDTKTTNTMDKQGRLVHGHGDSLGIGVTGKTQTADMWLKGLYTMSPQDLTDLQDRLFDQGWYTGTKVTDKSMIQHGRPDAATLQAYGSVLAEGARYQAAGKHISIDGVIALGGTMNGTGGNGAPYQKTNPADLTSALKSQSQQELGHDPSAADTAAYQDQYLSQEDAARREYTVAGVANRTEGVTSPPSPSAGAEAYVDQHNLADKIAYGTAVRQQEFFNMLKSPV